MYVYTYIYAHIYICTYTYVCTVQRHVLNNMEEGPLHMCIVIDKFICIYICIYV